MIHRRDAAAHLAAILACFALGCVSTGLKDPRPGTTFGEIFVDSPEVYGRERLVRDRLDQESWLLAQLGEVDKADFGYQAMVETHSFEGLSAGLALSADPKVGLYKEQTSKTRSDLRRSEEISRLEHKIEVARLERELDALGVGGDDEGDEGSPTDGGGDSASPGESTYSLTAPATSATALAEGAQELLPTALAASSAAKSSPVEKFRERLDLREEIRQQLLENNLDDVHDLLGNTLYRLQFDATVLPFGDTSAWAQVEVSLESPVLKCEEEEIKERLRPIYKRWLEALPLKLEAARSDAVNLLGTTEGVLALLDSAKELDPAAGEAALALRAQVKVTANSGPAPDPFKFLSQAITTIAQKRSIARPEIPKPDSEEDVEREIIANQVKKEFQGAIDPKSKFVVISVQAETWRFSASEPPKPEEATQPIGGPAQPQKADGLVEFCIRAKRESQIRGYSVTPKESAERVSRTSGSRTARELAASLGLIAGTVGLDGAIRQSKISEILQQASDRQPLIVGYGSSAGGEKDQEIAKMGWFIGPRFKLRNDGRGFDYRQRAIQNTLSAVASLPSWLPWVNVTVVTQWRPEDGAPRKDAPKPVTQTYRVDLPGDPVPITDGFYPQARRPAASFRRAHFEIRGNRSKPLLPPEIEIGRAETLQIFGTDLWRNPVIVIGSQKADRIEILPNMKGILATINKVQVPAGWAKDKTRGEVDAWLWTSEGETEIGRVTIFRSETEETKEEVDPGFKVTAQTTTVVMDPVKGTAALRVAFDLPTKPPASAVDKVTLELDSADWDEVATKAAGVGCIDAASLEVVKSCQGTLIVRNLRVGQSFDLKAYRGADSKKTYHPPIRISVE